MMEKLGAIENKEVQKYTCVFSDSHHKHGAKKQILKAKRLATNKRKERRKVRRQKNYHNCRWVPLEQEYYWPTIYRAGAAVVSTITS